MVGYERPLRDSNVPQYHTVKRILLSRRGQENASWPWLTECHNQNRLVDKIRANKFMLGAILDYQILSDTAWENARRLSEDVLGEPKHLWVAITGIEKGYWDSREAFDHYGLHRYPAAHRRVWRIGKDIVDCYSGDARRIWRSKTPPTVLKRLLQMQVGPEISRMIVGALIDTKQIEGQGDLKADMHVRRVLGRICSGEQTSAKEAHEIANRMVPNNSWELDDPLYWIGKKNCKKKSPLCNECDLIKVCTYAQRS